MWRKERIYVSVLQTVHISNPVALKYVVFLHVNCIKKVPSKPVIFPCM